MSGIIFDMWTKIPEYIYILIALSNLKNYNLPHCQDVSLASPDDTVSKREGRVGMRLIKRLFGREYMRRASRRIKIHSVESRK